MKKFNTLLLIISVYFISTLNAQQIHRCYTDQIYEEMKIQDPDLENRVEQAKVEARTYVQSENYKSDRAIIVIPVVVHVIHNGQAVGTSPNISEAQVQSQIDVLNEDFRMLNADIGSVPPHFASVVADSEVEFCLATIDPNGNITDGINRVDYGQSQYQESFINGTIKPATTWDHQKYLNIWVVNMNNGILGYATLPGTGANQDGVVVDYRYFGRAPHNVTSPYDLGRTATHEVGHWLGLAHTFQGANCAGNTATNCSFQGDGICDTPPQDGPNYGCNLQITQNTCTETPIDLPDMWMNYMDYSDDACLFMFSQDQAAVMAGVLNTTRAQIKTSSASCTSTFAFNGRVVDATTNQGLTNAKVTFYSGNYELSLTTDNLGNFTSSSFVEGTYSIYAGAWGYYTKEFSTNQFIADGSPQIVIPIESGIYYDDFVLDYDWTVTGSAITGDWERGVPQGTTFNSDAANPGLDVTGDFGQHAYVTGNAGGNAGDDDLDEGDATLLSPVFDLSSYTDPYLSYYRWFYNGGGSGDPLDDTLTISITNGTNTVEIERVDASMFNTNNWNFNKIRISDYLSLSGNMRFIVSASDFAPTGHIVEAGIDQFKVQDSVNVSVRDIAELSEFIVYPNPASDRVNLQIAFDNPADAVIEIFSTAGQKVYNLQSSLQNRSVVPVDISDLSSGIYTVRITSDRGISSKKFSIVR